MKNWLLVPLVIVFLLTGCSGSDLAGDWVVKWSEKKDPCFYTIFFLEDNRANATNSSNLQLMSFTYEKISQSKYTFTSGKYEENLDIQIKNNLMTMKFKNGQVCHYRKMKETSGT